MNFFLETEIFIPVLQIVFVRGSGGEGGMRATGSMTACTRIPCVPVCTFDPIRERDKETRGEMDASR